MIKRYLGWYSAKAAAQFGTHIYSRADGSEVEITCAETIMPVGEPAKYEYGWPDKVCVGEVCVKLRDGSTGELGELLMDESLSVSSLLEMAQKMRASLEDLQPFQPLIPAKPKHKWVN